MSWRFQYEGTIHTLLDGVVLEKQAFNQLALPFCQFLQSFKNDGFLKSEVDLVHGDFLWKKYVNALDAGPSGLLQANMQALVNKFDLSAKKAGLEIDLLSFAPTFDRAIATPLRFARTPGKSVVSKSIARNVLRSTVSLGSGIGKALYATPLTAINLPAKDETQAIKMVPIIMNLLDKNNIDTNGFRASVPTIMRERVQSVFGIFICF